MAVPLPPLTLEVFRALAFANGDFFPLALLYSRTVSPQLPPPAS